MRKKELEKIVKFICTYNKDDIGATAIYYGTGRIEFRFKYLYDGKLMETKGIWADGFTVVKNEKEKAILEVYSLMLKVNNRYYELIKANGKLTDITEYYKPNKENNNEL